MMKRFLSISFILFLLCSLSGCHNKAEVDKDSIYYFAKYQNEEVFDIEQIDLSSRLSKSCISYQFTYTSDNYQVKAYISIPLTFIENETPGKCILYNRGGNSKIGLLEEEDTAKLCAATNRIIIASQYRGADGGDGKDEFGGEDLHDVIKLIDLCDTHFSFIDMDDFCVAGVSRGGMMTYLTAKQDHRVKRIIVISAVSDLFQSYEDREDMQEVLYNYIGATPEQNPDEYKKRSAIYWSDKITVPVLMIHSKFDEQVSFSQSEGLYEKLKQNHTDISFHVRDDNIHGLSDKDLEVILDWLNKNN